jgi:ATP-dependent RNA helicase DeaD
MLCRHGNITKTQVGSIKIFDAETHVEFRPEALDKFLQAIGPSRKLEKTITVDRVVGDSVSAGRTEKRRGVSGAATRRARRSHGDSPSQETTSNVSHIQTNELDIKPGEAAPNQRKPKKLKNSKKPKVHKGKTKTNFKEAKSRKAKPGEEKQRRAKPKKGRSKTPAA